MECSARTIPIDIFWSQKHTAQASIRPISNLVGGLQPLVSSFDVMPFAWGFELRSIEISRI